MKTFSVLTVSKRNGWFEDAIKQVEKQTIKPTYGGAEWVVVQEDYHGCSTYITNGEGDAEIQVLMLNAPPKTKFSNLNASLNEGLRHITRDYVIFYQDFIRLQENCFEKLLALAAPDIFVTTCTPNYDGSDDGRYTGCDMPRPCRPEEWEANVSIAPMQMLKDIGGFEEELDGGWSWDNVNVAQRAAMVGAKFICDESNRPRLLPHEQTSKLALRLNGELNDRLIRETREGKRPINVGYL